MGAAAVADHPALYLWLLSPDRQAYIVLGDPSLTIFTTPSNVGLGARAWLGQVVQPYVASIPFAQDYAMKGCTEFFGSKSGGFAQRVTSFRCMAVHPFARGRPLAIE
jgi:hypothetical protein